MKVILFFGFFVSYVNILRYSFPLGIGFLFSIIIMNIVFHFLYYNFFKSYKEDIQNEKILLFQSSLKEINPNINTDCVICFDRCSTKDIVSLNCSCQDKYYHYDCLKKWLCKNGSCPFCRKKMFFS